MKLSFVLTLLASMAILSLGAPLMGNNDEEAMLEALSATLGAQTDDSASAHDDATVDVETAMTGDLSRMVRYITITNPRDTWMAISWVACFDHTGKNLCAGKPATANTHHGGNGAMWGTPTTPLTDAQNFGTHGGNAYHTGSPSAGNWWKVDLQAGFDITIIKFGPRNDAPSQGAGLIITMQDVNGITIPGAINTFTTTEDRTQTFAVGNHVEHTSPIGVLLDSLKAKIERNMQTSNTDVSTKQAASRAAASAADQAIQAARKSADQASGIATDAGSVRDAFVAQSLKELQMIAQIQAMVTTLRGKTA